MNRNKKKWMRAVAVGCLVAAVVVFTQAPQVSADNTKSNAKAKNVILLISDGCGFNCFQATSYYQYGEVGKQVYERFPFKVGATTYEYEYLDYTPATHAFWGPWYAESGKYTLKGFDTNEFWSDFNYPIWIDTSLGNPLTGWYVNNNTDSASAATAMATGFKTKDGSIGYAFPLNPDGSLVVDSDGKSYTEPKQNIVEIAESFGMSTGVVSSVPFSHATPAGFVAHKASRGDTLGIAKEMLYESKVEVIMAPASPDYEHNGTLRADPTSRLNEYLGGAVVFNDIQDGYLDNQNNVDANHDSAVDEKDQFVVIRDKSAFQSMAEGPTPNRVFGLPRVRQTLQYYRDGDKFAAPYEVKFIENVPTLAEMSEAALNVLDNNPKGFFLMIEGGAVDWANHSGHGGRMIEEQVDFNRAVEAVVEWVEENSNWGETMVIVTSDHETGYIWGPDSNPVYNPLINNGTGNMPGMQYYSPIGWHTNSLVPLFAKGAAARLFNGYATNTDLVYGSHIDNTDIFKILKYSIENYQTGPGKGNKPSPVPPREAKK